jgi:hypothetical protein
MSATRTRKKTRIVGRSLGMNEHFCEIPLVNQSGPRRSGAWESAPFEALSSSGGFKESNAR